MGKVKVKNEKVRMIASIPVINFHVAGIDVHDSEMFVAYPVNSESIQVKTFGTFTSDLKLIVETLKDAKVTSVAMESTGVYWVTLFLLLQEEGFEVYLVNSQQTKNVAGRKEDDHDALWIHQLHSCGLLKASFQPDKMTRALREMVRHRKNLVETTTDYINRMQKALELMNIKLHTVISDIDGKSGRKIIEAILAGERDPEVLADLRDVRIKASREVIIKSLEGYWLNEHLFSLKQCYQLYSTHRELINECDKEIEKQLIEQIASTNGGEIPEIPQISRKVSTKNKIPYNLTSILNEILGVDITRVTGLSELSVLTIMSEVGTDMSKWKTQHHFTSWINVVPNTKMSGGKIISSRVKKKKNNVGQVFRIAANSLYKSQTPLGDYYRRIKASSGASKAVVATARKLAIIYYIMVSRKQEYNPIALEEYQRKYKEMKINNLKKKLAQLEAA